MSTTITQLGVGLHHDIPASIYHADPCVEPSLSSGVARVLVEQSPAHAYLQHIRLGGRKSAPTPEMVLGGYVHGLLADDVTDFSVGEFDNYQTKAAREWRDTTEATGKTPILERSADRAGLIATALREKVANGITNDPFAKHGRSEVTAIWQEDRFWFRARFDRLVLDPSGYADIWDWKTTGSVAVEAIRRTIIDHGYHIQAAHYIRGLRAIAPQYAGRISFNLAFVETEAPYAVRRVVMSEGFLGLGDMQLGRAIQAWRNCRSANEWPEGTGETLTLTPPAWFESRVMEDAA